MSLTLAVVGSTKLGKSVAARRCIEMVFNLWNPSKVISGAANGIDTLVITVAKERGIPFEEFPPTRQCWPAFKIRNMKIATECHALVRIALRGATTYGSGWTRDRAREMGKPTVEYVILSGL
jgi:hypothetical protein